MRIAIPEENGRVCEHFGRCESFAVFDIENGKVVKKFELAAPEHEPGVFPRFLAENGIELLICCGIGPRALQLLQTFGIKVIPGVEGSITEVIAKFLRNELKASKPKCEHL